jgi:hypothetical protein
MKKNWQIAVLAVILAVLSWYLIVGREKVEVLAEVPVEISSAPSGLVIREGLKPTVKVRVRGSKGLISNLGRQDLVYSLDLSSITPGTNTILLRKENINIPAPLELVEFMPGRLTLEVERLVENTVPVVLDWEGRLAEDWKLRKAQVMPEDVLLKGPRSLVSPMEEVRTRTLFVDNDTPDTVSQEVSLALAEEVSSEPPTVRARLEFGPELEDIWVKLPLQVSSGPRNLVRIDPAEVRLHLRLPRRMLSDDAFRDDIKPRLTVPIGSPPGTRSMDYVVDLPRYGEILEKRPQRVEVTITRR